MELSTIGEEFDKSAIKKRKGAFGIVSYVGLGEYIKQLNKIFDYQWDFFVEHGQVVDGFAVVLGKLIAGGITKMQYGTSRVTVSKSKGEITQIGDDYKAAASDCLKKCASSFGIGLHLYDGTEEGVSDNAELLQRIAKGEDMIVNASGGDANVLLTAIRGDTPPLSEATGVQLKEYYEKLLAEHKKITTMESTDGEDA